MARLSGDATSGLNVTRLQTIEPKLGAFDESGHRTVLPKQTFSDPGAMAGDRPDRQGERVFNIKERERVKTQTATSKRHFSYQGAIPDTGHRAAKSYSPTSFKEDKDTSLRVKKKK